MENWKSNMSRKYTLEDLDLVAENLQNKITVDYLGRQYKVDLIMDTLLACNGANLQRAVQSGIQMFEVTTHSLDLFVEILDEHIRWIKEN